MKQKGMYALVAVMMIELCATSALAQGFGRVSGRCTDLDGKPIVGATIRYLSKDTGQKYEIKTNEKGEYTSLAVSVAHTYDVTLIGPEGNEIYHFTNVLVAPGDNDPLNFDLKKLQQQAVQKSGMNAEQVKQAQEQVKQQQSAAAKETETIKALQEKLNAANDASKAGDYDTAIALLTQATSMDATRDVLWYQLGDAYAQSAAKQADNGEKSKRLESAVTDFQKAIDLKKADIQPANMPEKKPDAAKQAQANKNLAGYYNNLGNAYGHSGNAKGAVDAYNQAAQIDPSNGGMYFFNLGAIMTNGGHVDEAIVAFDKAIAADPTKAAAYYWKGVNLMGKGTLDKENKMVFPSGTADAFNKYLELEPTGNYAQPAKDLLATMGASVETSFGKKKSATPKK